MNIKRNDLCPCGSGKKYKKCHGKIELEQKRVQRAYSVSQAGEHPLAAFAQRIMSAIEAPAEKYPLPGLPESHASTPEAEMPELSPPASESA